MFEIGCSIFNVRLRLSVRQVKLNFLICGLLIDMRDLGFLPSVGDVQDALLDSPKLYTY